MPGSSLFSSLGSFSSISSAVSCVRTSATLHCGPRNVGAVSAYDGPQPSAATVCQPSDGLHRSTARPSAAAGQAARDRAALKQRATDAAVANTHATPNQGARARAVSRSCLKTTKADAPPTTSTPQASHARPGGESASREHSTSNKFVHFIARKPVAKAAAPARPEFKAGFLNSVPIPSFRMEFTL